MSVSVTKPQGSFNLGQIVATPGAIDALATLNLSPLLLLNRHKQGDWGDVDSEDWEANNQALQTGERLFSAYIIQNIKFWVITERDRSVTTVLLPEEY